MLALPRPDPALENSGVKISLSLPPRQLQVMTDERIIALFPRSACEISTVISPHFLLPMFNVGVMRNKEADGGGELPLPSRLPVPAQLPGILQRLGESLGESRSWGEVRRAASWRMGGFSV